MPDANIGGMKFISSFLNYAGGRLQAKRADESHKVIPAFSDASTFLSFRLPNQLPSYLGYILEMVNSEKCFHKIILGNRTTKLFAIIQNSHFFFKIFGLSYFDS